MRMAKNDIIEVGSKANVILSFIEDINILDEDYAAFEPYIYLKEVNVILEYKGNKKTSTSLRNINNFNLANLNKVIIGGASFSKKLASLFMCYISSTTSEEKREFITSTAYSGEIYLTKDIANQDSIYVYDQELNKIQNFDYVPASNSITSDHFDEGKNYLISFSSELVGTKFSLKQRSIPYMKMEIQGLGNINKSTKNVLLSLSKVSLDSLLELNFIPNNKINFPLEFTVIDNEKEYSNFLLLED